MYVATRPNATGPSPSPRSYATFQTALTAAYWFRIAAWNMAVLVAAWAAPKPRPNTAAAMVTATGFASHINPAIPTALVTTAGAMSRIGADPVGEPAGVPAGHSGSAGEEQQRGRNGFGVEAGRRGGQERAEHARGGRHAQKDHRQPAQLR